MAGLKDTSGSALERLREFGLRYPGAHTKSPWPGHLDLAVNDKTFAYMSVAGEPLKISCKLPRSADAALGLPFTTPTGYGLGKSGWVTATFPDGTSVPEELLEEWIDESYRAQAPKRLSAKLRPYDAEASVESTATLARHAAPPAAEKALSSAARKVRAARQPAGKAAPPRPGSDQVAARPGSTVKQATVSSGSRASAPARSAKRRAPAPAVTVSVAPPRRAARGAAVERTAATARASKRASVSQRAAKRTPKKRTRPSA